MDQVSVAILQTNEVTLDRVCFGAFGGEEASAFGDENALAGEKGVVHLSFKESEVSFVIHHDEVVELAVVQDLPVAGQEP